MLNLKLKDYSQLLPDVGKQRVLPFITQYYKQLIATTVLNKLESLPETFNGDLYDGEAEQLLYRPLAQWLRTTIEVREQGGTAEDDSADNMSFSQFMFSSAVDYAVIHEFFKTQLANRITATEQVFKSVKESLIIQSMAEVSKSGTALNKLKWEANPAGASEISKFFEEIMPDGGLEVLNAITSIIAKTTKSITDDVDLYDKKLTTKIEELKKYLRRGKGTPATTAQRELLLRSRMEVINQIKCLIAPMAGITIPGNKCTKSDFYDGFTAAVYLFEYLKIVQDYDVNFPYSPPNGNAFAYAATLTAQARNLSGKFMRFYDLPAKVDLLQSINMLNMAIKPYTTVLDDFFPRWREDSDVYTTRIEQWLPTVDSFITIFWEEAVKRQLTFGEGAELLVDLVGVTDSLKQVATNAAAKLSDSVHIEWDKEKLEWKIDGETLHDNFSKFPVYTPGTIGDKVQVSEVVHVPLNRQIANKIYFIFMDSAEAIMNTIQMIAESKALGNRLTTAFEAAADNLTLTSDYWQFLPLMGSLKHAEPAPFKMIDPLSRVFTPWYLKLTEKSATSKWKLKDWMYRIISYHAVNNAVMNSVADIFTWDHSAYPQDDAVTALYVNGLIPACYTKDRRRDWSPYSINTLLDRIASSGGFHDNWEYFETAAVALNTLEAEYTTTIVDALAANVLVYSSVPKKGTIDEIGDDDIFNLLPPELPVMWTAQTRDFIEQQKDAEGKSRSKIGEVEGKLSASVTGKQVKAMKLTDLAAVATVKNEKVGRINYAFVLHTHYPAPTQTIQRLWKARYKTYIPIYISNSIKGLEDKPIVSQKLVTDKGSINYVAAAGWSILQNPWPHINAQCKPLNLGWTEWTPFQLVDVFCKPNELMRTIDFRAKSERDASILDDEDEAQALAFPDPDWTTTGREIPAYDPEIVRISDAKKAFITGEAEKPDYAAPRGTSDIHRSLDLVKTIWTPMLSLSDEGVIQLRGGMASASDMAKSILAGATYIDKESDEIIGFSEEHLPDKEQVSKDPEEAVKQITAFLDGVKEKKSKKAKAKKTSSEDGKNDVQDTKLEPSADEDDAQ